MSRHLDPDQSSENPVALAHREQGPAAAPPAAFNRAVLEHLTTHPGGHR